MIKVEDLELQIGGFKLGPLNFMIRKEEFLVILGPSGSGKTLFLETLAGVRMPLRGRVLIDGREILSLPPEKRRIGIVYQELFLFPHLKVKDNILYGKHAKKEILEEFIDILGIRQILNRYPHELSGGEKQRVTILRALVNQPLLLLLDEPFSSLDRAIKEDAVSLVLKLKRRLNVPTIMVTHDFEEAVMLADRIAVMKDGKILDIDTPTNIFKKPAHTYIAEFTGVKNFLLLEKRDDGYYLGETKITLTHKVEDDTIIATLRPEDIIISLTPVSTSARNVVPARVSEIKKRGVINEVVTESGGQNITAYITDASLEELELKEKKEVFLVFKTTALHLLR